MALVDKRGDGLLEPGAEKRHLQSMKRSCLRRDVRL